MILPAWFHSLEQSFWIEKLSCLLAGNKIKPLTMTGCFINCKNLTQGIVFGSITAYLKKPSQDEDPQKAKQAVKQQQKHWLLFEYSRGVSKLMSFTTRIVVPEWLHHVSGLAPR